MTDRTRPLCANPRCAIPGRHCGDCGTDCRGCQPAWAADGLRLCGHCTRRLGQDAVKAARLHGELELVLRPSGAGGGHVQPSSASPPRDDVVAMRTEIRHVLVAWCRLVSEERGISPPADDVTAMGAYLVRHAEWLAAREYAGEAADELAGLAGRAWGLAYPSGTRRLDLHESCPYCDAELTATMRPQDGGLLPSDVVCAGEEHHTWPADQWRKLDRLVARRRAVA